METLEVFNKNNEKIGEAPRSEVHEKGLYHRSVSVFLINSKGKVYLQKRAHDKETAPGCWDMSVIETLKPGESYGEAAMRGLKEEINITKIKLIKLRGSKLLDFVYENGYIDKEFNELYLARTDQIPKPDKKEVIDGKFFSVKEIEKMTETMKFTPWFYDEWEDFKKNRSN